MKTAIIISGQIRTGTNSKIYNSILKLIELLDADLFISTWDKLGISYNSNINDKNFLIKNESRDFINNFIKNIFNPKKFTIKTSDDFENELNDFKKNLLNFSKKEIIQNKYTSIYQSYILKEGWNILKDFEDLNNFKYQKVLRLRPDFLLSDHYEIKNKLFSNASLVHINTEWCYSPNRVYDVLFGGDRYVMEKLFLLWNNYDLEFNSDYSLDRYLPADMCRMLISLCFRNNILPYRFETVVGDIVREEDLNDHFSKVSQRLKKGIKKDILIIKLIRKIIYYLKNKI